jgi:hypothetical protein
MLWGKPNRHVALRGPETGASIILKLVSVNSLVVIVRWSASGTRDAAAGRYLWARTVDTC